METKRKSSSSSSEVDKARMEEDISPAKKIKSPFTSDLANSQSKLTQTSSLMIFFWLINKSWTLGVDFQSRHGVRQPHWVLPQPQPQSQRWNYHQGVPMLHYQGFATNRTKQEGQATSQTQASVKLYDVGFSFICWNFIKIFYHDRALIHQETLPRAIPMSQAAPKIP